MSDRRVSRTVEPFLTSRLLQGFSPLMKLRS